MATLSTPTTANGFRGRSRLTIAIGAISVAVAALALTAWMASSLLATTAAPATTSSGPTVDVLHQHLLRENGPSAVGGLPDHDPYYQHVLRENGDVNAPVIRGAPNTELYHQHVLRENGAEAGTAS